MSTTNERKPYKFSVAIVGGGIGGLCLALGLLEHPDIDVQIYESAPTFGEIGFGVNIAVNAQRALAMISPKANASFKKEATGNMWESHAGSFDDVIVGMAGPDENRLITRQSNASGLQSLHRAKFLDELVTHVPAERTHFNKRVSLVEQFDSTSKLKLHFKDGSSAEADCVIGADGIHSQIRKLILPKGHIAMNPTFAGTACYRAVVPMADAVAKVGAEYAQNCHLLCGQGASIFSYPIEHGQSFNIIVIELEHKTWTNEQWIVPCKRDKLESILKGWGSTAQGMIDLLDKPGLSAWGMHDNPSVPFFNKGRICLLGDAAHASTPFQGQGAGQAIEDALVLKTLLGAVENVSQLRFAFRAFDLVRRTRTQQVVRTSREFGQTQGMMGEFTGSDLGKMKEEMDYNMRWMWNRDLDDQNLEALKLFQEAIAEP